MNKINIIKIYIIAMLFIALLPNISMADTRGQGTENDPYIITYDDNKIIYNNNKEPIFFIVAQPGTYKINHEIATQTITFIRMMDEKDSRVTKSESVSYTEKQLGVRTAEDPSINVTPKYKITDVSSYLYYDERKEEYSVNSLNVTLTNAYDKNYGGSVHEDYYFFTNPKNIVDEHSVFDPLFNSPGDEDDFYKYYEDNFTYPSLCIPKEDSPGVEEALEEYQDQLNIQGFSVPGPTGHTAVKAMYKLELEEPEEVEKGNWIEEMITRFLEMIGDTVLGLLRTTFGNNLSIDTLIFNEFDDTKIDLYKKSNVELPANSINSILRKVINTWFNIFSNIVYVGYIIVLVYIGISIIGSSGTPRQNKAKESLVNWFVGIIILVFFPRYGIPLIIDINNALVSYIGKGSKDYKTYYNAYGFGIDNKNMEDVYGSDSTTVSIDVVVNQRNKARQDLLEAYYGQASGEMNGTVDIIAGKVLNNSGLFDTEEKKKYIDTAIRNYITQLGLFAEKNNGEINFSEIQENYKGRLMQDMTSYSYVTGDMINAILDELFNPNNEETLKKCATNLYEASKSYEEKKDLIDAIQLDIMGTMRIMSGVYHRVVYTLMWLMLVFQLLGLTFLYYKRLFIIAILIVAFPFIMLFYCIDKMADGSAQSLKHWFKEFLANVFVQTVHAVIYRVLVEMGMTIYNRTNNWIFFVAAMLMILPAESLLKEIFDLNGSTLRKVGGMAKKAADTVKTAVNIKNIKGVWKGRNDTSEVQKREAMYNKIQQKQDRADAKARTREAQELALNPEHLHSDGSVELTGKRAEQQAKYNAQTAKREKQVEKLNHKGVGDAVRIARNVTAVTMGAAYGIAAGDFASGVQTANLISGSTSTKKPQRYENGEKKDLKKELKVAYSRKNNKS